MTDDPDDRFRDGEGRRDEGMERAARSASFRIRRDEFAFLTALLESPDGTAVIDAATEEHYLCCPYERGGKWRGAVPKRLADHRIIRQLKDSSGQLAVRRSTRPTRHASPVFVWKLIDAAAARRRAASLATWLAEHGKDAEQPPRGLFDDLD